MSCLSALGYVADWGASYISSWESKGTIGIWGCGGPDKGPTTKSFWWNQNRIPKNIGD